MAYVYSPSEVDAGLLMGLRVAVLGYGNQGRAHALNLRDAGVEVVVGARRGGKGWTAAETEGQVVLDMGEVMTADVDVVMMTLPDEKMGELFSLYVQPHVKQGMTLLFAHGFAVHFGFVRAPENVNVAMVSPKGPGWGLRQLYEEGRGLPAYVAVAQNADGRAEAIALSYAHALGCFRSAVYRTTFEEECVSDLFGEQVVLCGGVIELAKSAFTVLVESGVDPEAAYFECVHEMKLIVDLVVSRGLEGMREAISDTAEYGGYVAGPRVINEESRRAMREVLAEIRSGEFARRWVEEARTGSPFLLASRAEEAAHPAAEAGRSVRQRIFR